MDAVPICVQNVACIFVFFTGVKVHSVHVKQPRSRENNTFMDKIPYK